MLVQTHEHKAPSSLLDPGNQNRSFDDWLRLFVMSALLEMKCGPVSKIISGTFSYEKTGHPQPDLMREAQMVDHELCRLTGRRCYQSYYGGAPCSKTPTLNDARECLIALGEKNKELEGEIQQADRWIGRLSLQILANPASERIKN